MEETKYTVTLFETCEKLNKSKKSISRYIRKGLLHPKEVKSKQGTLEYRFSESDLEAFKQKQSETRQDRQDTQDKTDEIKKEKIVNPLPEENIENKESVLDKSKTEETRQDTPDGTEQTGHIYSKGEEKEKKILDKAQTDETGHERQDGTGQDKTGQKEIIELLKETTGLLKDQLAKKDEQIKDLDGKIDQLIERDRETNILIGQLQSKVLMLEQPKPEQTRQDKENKEGFLKKLFNGKL
jgi:hypothetical protein